MTNQISDGDALVVLSGPRAELETALDKTLLLLREALKTAEATAPDRALQLKAAQVAALAAQLQKRCADTSAKQFEPLQPSHDVSDDWSGSKAKSGNATAPQPSVWSGFYNKTLRERLDVLALMYPRLKTLKTQSAPGADAADILPPADPAAKLGELPLRTANLMIENCIGVLGIPLG
jgi:hypothetical protein